MGFQSELFRGDRKLETCVNRPSVETHITVGTNDRGDHVTKIQHALVVLDCALAKIGGDEIKAQLYGTKTAAAVLAYKQPRQIINRSYQNKADAIVGPMTMASMDKEMFAREAEIPELLRAARVSAFQRCFTAFQRCGGIGPPAPRPGQIDPNAAARARARTIAIQIFNLPNPDMDDIADGIRQMQNFLASPNLPIVRALVNQKDCGFRDGFVTGNRLPITLCANFFARCTSNEARTRTMVHEAAHLIGVGDSGGELYYLRFNCRNEEPQISSGVPTDRKRIAQADTWAKFVNCVSGQPPDKDDVLTRKGP